ncbi:MAG: hypothetical protein ACREO3_07845, partial [Arenimonas sp.]
MLQPILRSAFVATVVAIVGVAHLPVVTAAPAADAPVAPVDRFIVRYKDVAPDKAAVAGRRALLEGVGSALHVDLASERRLALGAELVRADRGL